MAGSSDFSQTVRRLRDLSIAFHYASGDLELFHKEGRLADDFPRLFMSNVASIEPAYRRAFIHSQNEAVGSIFSTHPSDRERIGKCPQETNAARSGTATPIFQKTLSRLFVRLLPNLP